MRERQRTFAVVAAKTEAKIKARDGTVLTVDTKDEHKGEVILNACNFPYCIVIPRVSPLRRRTVRDVRKDSRDEGNIVFSECNALSAISHCDEGMTQVNEKKDDLEADVVSCPPFWTARSEWFRLSSVLWPRASWKKTTCKRDERKTFTKYKEDLEQDVSGVPKVLERIRNFSETLFVQQRDAITFKTNRSWVVQTSSRVMCHGCERSVSSFSGCLLSDSGQSRFKHPLGMNRLCLTLTGIERWESHESNKSRQLERGLQCVQETYCRESGHSSCSAKGDGRNV